jgi:hypothetical protein
LKGVVIAGTISVRSPSAWRSLKARSASLDRRAICSEPSPPPQA